LTILSQPAETITGALGVGGLRTYDDDDDDE